MIKSLYKYLNLKMKPGNSRTSKQKIGKQKQREMSPDSLEDAYSP